MTTVEQVAAEAGRPTEEILELCGQLGIVASAGASGLSRDEHERLRSALGFDGLEPVTAGSVVADPGRSVLPTEATLRERAAQLSQPAAPVRRRISPRALTRVVIYSFLVIAILMAVVTLRSRAEEGLDLPGVNSFGPEDIGTCVDLDEGGGGPQVQIAACADPHDAELYLVGTFAGDDFPGSDALRDRAEELCRPAFEDHVGETHAASELDVIYLVPTPGTWAIGDRSILCLIEDATGPLIGSVAGTAG